MHPWPGPVSQLYYGWCRLGRDMNGVVLHSEKEAWLKSQPGWDEDGMREAGEYLFMVLENEMGDIRRKLFDLDKAEAKKGGKR